MGQRNAIHNKRIQEQKARTYWNDGKLVRDRELYNVPKVGEMWPKEYLPYWRKWMEERNERTYHFEAWATVLDEEFWWHATRRLKPSTIAYALGYAGTVGNVAAFSGVQCSEAVELYANTVGQPVDWSALGKHGWATKDILLEQAQHRVVHPNVVAKMQALHLWNDDHFVVLAQAYGTGWHRPQPGLLRADWLHRGLFGFGHTFLSDWGAKMLGYFSSNAQSQARFLAHCMLELGHTSCAWVRRDDVAPHVHPDIDMPMLEQATGAHFAWSLHPMQYSDGVVHLHKSVHHVALALQKKVPWTKPGLHEGLALMMEMTPAENALDLYNMAMQCKRVELGLAPAVEALALPTM